MSSTHARLLELTPLRSSRGLNPGGSFHCVAWLPSCVWHSSSLFLETLSLISACCFLVSSRVSLPTIPLHRCFPASNRGLLFLYVLPTWACMRSRCSTAPYVSLRVPFQVPANWLSVLACTLGPPAQEVKRKSSSFHLFLGEWCHHLPISQAEIWESFLTWPFSPTYLWLASPDDSNPLKNSRNYLEGTQRNWPVLFSLRGLTSWCMT